MQQRKILIIAGPNGAGKTTFAHAFLPNEARCPRFINADLIAAGLSPFAPQLAAIKAGRIMLQEMQECVRQRVSFAFETTLAGLTYLRHIRHWRGMGYMVILYFLALPDAQAAIARVATRVKQGGHAVDETVIRRRFAAGLRNLEKYKASVDIWEYYDASQNPPIHVATWKHAMNHADNNMDAAYPGPNATLAALRRAAQAARQLAMDTNTDLIVMQNGKLVHIPPQELRRQQEAKRHVKKSMPD